MREVDTVSRFGGDEFADLLSELIADKTESIKEVGIIAEKIRIKLAEPYLLTIGHKGAVPCPQFDPKSFSSLFFATIVASRNTQ